MDPVNKWLLTIILFMSAVLVVAWNIGSVGRYEFSVERSLLFADHAVVYVLDTKDGDVKAQLFDKNDLHYNNNIKNTAQEVMSFEGAGYGHRY